MAAAGMRAWLSMRSERQPLYPPCPALRLPHCPAVLLPACRCRHSPRRADASLGLIAGRVAWLRTCQPQKRTGLQSIVGPAGLHTLPHAPRAADRPRSLPAQPPTWAEHRARQVCVRLLTADSVRVPTVTQMQDAAAGGSLQGRAAGAGLAPPVAPPPPAAAAVPPRMTLLLYRVAAALQLMGQLLIVAREAQQAGPSSLMPQLLIVAILTVGNVLVFALPSLHYSNRCAPTCAARLLLVHQPTCDVGGQAAVRAWWAAWVSLRTCA